MASAPQNDNVAHALAGAGGGVLSMILTYPLITLSTRAQVESSRAHTTFAAAVRSIVAREGVAGLYAGLDSAVFGISVTNFVYYYWYEWTRAFFAAAALRSGRRSQKLTTLESMIAGAVAGSATVIMTNPIWVINTRMTTRRATTGAQQGEADELAKRSTTVGTLLKLLREEGPSALFSGVVPALVLVINPILQYTLFEQMKNAWERRQRRKGLQATGVTPHVAFLLGALGKLFATSITYPYITVKSQMHVGGGKKGMAESMRAVLREEGWRGLYKGIGPKVTQSVLTAAFLFAFKDVLYAQTVRLRSTMAQRRLKAA